MRCVLRTLRDAKVDLKAAKDYIRECTYGKLGTRSPTRRSGDTHREAVSPWDANRERGMVRRSDRYLADQYLRRERCEGRAHAAWPGESDRKTPRLLGYGITLRRPKHEEWAPGPDRWRAGVGRGYPLGRGRTRRYTTIGQRRLPFRPRGPVGLAT